MFPRTLRSGAPVKTCDDLVAYMLERCPGARRAFLGFQGKNQVVYRT